MEEIESGQNLRRANMTPRRASRDRASQRSVGGRTSGWTSTESLASTTSEDGRSVFPAVSQNKSQPLSPSSVFSPTLLPGSKLPPPPPPRNPRVEKTLLETSRRLQQEQGLTPVFSNVPQNVPDFPKIDTRDGALASASLHLSPDNQMGQISTPLINQPIGGWNRISPQNSGMSTPASTSGMSSLPPGQLQTVREQMAAALRQLKEMEEKVKGIPVLEREVYRLREEKEKLLVALQKKTEELSAVVEARKSEPAANAHLPLSLDVGRPEQGLKSLDILKTPSVLTTEKRSIAVGSDAPLEAAMVKKSQKHVAVEAFADVCNRAIETDPKTVRDEEVQTKVRTDDASVWVVESLLGLSNETELEIKTLRETVNCQQETITFLKERLTQTNRDLEQTRTAEIAKRSKVMLETGTLVKPETVNVQVETERRPKASVGVGVSEKDFARKKTDRSVQTTVLEQVKEKPAVVQVSKGVQWEDLSTDKLENQEKSVAAEGKYEHSISSNHDIIFYLIKEVTKYVLSKLQGH